VQSSGKSEEQTDKISNNEDGSSSDEEGEENIEAENNLFTVPGRKGLYSMTEKIQDKYAARPEGVEELTLSQFATSYSRCKKSAKNC
jgi:hypothetical protein